MGMGNSTSTAKTHGSQPRPEPAQASSGDQTHRQQELIAKLCELAPGVTEDLALWALRDTDWNLNRAADAILQQSMLDPMATHGSDGGRFGGQTHRHQALIAELCALAPGVTEDQARRALQAAKWNLNQAANAVLRQPVPDLLGQLGARFPKLHPDVTRAVLVASNWNEAEAVSMLTALADEPAPEVGTVVAGGSLCQPCEIVPMRSSPMAPLRSLPPRPSPCSFHGEENADETCAECMRFDMEMEEWKPKERPHKVFDECLRSQILKYVDVPERLLSQLSKSSVSMVASAFDEPVPVPVVQVACPCPTHWDGKAGHVETCPMCRQFANEKQRWKRDESITFEVSLSRTGQLALVQMPLEDLMVGELKPHLRQYWQLPDGDHIYLLTQEDLYFLDQTWQPANVELADQVRVNTIHVRRRMGGGTVKLSMVHQSPVNVVLPPPRPPEQPSRRPLQHHSMDEPVVKLRMCPKCGSGPVENSGCNNLAEHHVVNRCYTCNYYSSSWRDWLPWDGEQAVALRQRYGGESSYSATTSLAATLGGA